MPVRAWTSLPSSRGVPRFLHAAHDVFGVACAPDALGLMQRKVKGVLADHPDGSHGDLDAGTAVVAVEYHQVGRDFVPGDDVALRHPGQQPDLAAALQGTGGLVGDALAQQVVGELEGFAVLHHLVAVGHNPERGVVAAAGIGLVAGDAVAGGGVDAVLLHLPIQPGQNEGIAGSGGVHDLYTEAVPGLFADIKHGFDTSRHSDFSFAF